MRWSEINTMAVFGDAPPPEAEQQALRLSPSPVPVAIPRAIPGAVRAFDAGTTMGEDGAAPASQSGGRRADDINPGTLLLGRYRIVRRLGTGGFARVYLANDEWLDEEIAVKVPDLHDGDNVIVKTFKSQLKAWKFLSERDPGKVVRLLHAEHVRVGNVNAPCIFMEYMPGGTLERMAATRWQSYPHNPEQLAHLMRLFLQVCRAVRFLHEHNALHRDIKPANILLDETLTTCKLSDFELIDHRQGGVAPATLLGGTPAYMAPECVDNAFSEASDIYALGVTLYHLLTGRPPFEVSSFFDRNRPTPTPLSELNPLVSPELQQVVMRCLETRPEHRPQSVDDLIADLAYVGVSDAEANAAPVNLARLLMSHLSEDDREHLVQTLTEDEGYRSVRKEAAQFQADLVQEYCYMASPRDVLADNCTTRQLSRIAEEMGLGASKGKGREGLISDILEAVGFLPGPQNIPGIESARGFLETQLMGLAHATTIDECSGMAHSGLAAVERTVDLLVRFFGQLFHGSGFSSFLSRHSNGKPWGRLTFGEKAGALRNLCTKRPQPPPPDRIRQVFEWPIIPVKLFEQLDELVTRRNRLAHQIERGDFHDSQRSARQVLAAAVEVVTELAANRYVPRVVQIISRQDDIYGRHFYLGKDDRGHSERIFTPLPLSVGRLYLFYPLTNPVRINPLIFPFDTRPEESGGKKMAAGAGPSEV